MAATGTPTPNIGLRRPQGTDPASVDDINYNSACLDTVLGAVGNTSVKDQLDALNNNLSDLFYIGSSLSSVSALYAKMVASGEPSLSINIVSTSLSAALGCNSASGICIARYNGTRIDYLCFTGTQMAMGRIASDYTVTVNWTST